jgi:hypothetical protein
MGYWTLEIIHDSLLRKASLSYWLRHTMVGFTSSSSATELGVKPILNNNNNNKKY